jgi:PAS domain S-box-containing protein
LPFGSIAGSVLTARFHWEQPYRTLVTEGTAIHRYTQQPRDSQIRAVQPASSNVCSIDEHPTHRYLRLRGVLTNVEDVAYRYSFLTNRFDYVSPEITRLLGFTVEEMLAMEVAETVARIHIDDAPPVGTTVQPLHPGECATLYYRFLAKDGCYRWLADHYQIITNAEERPRCRMGVMRDITRQKAGQQGWHRLYRVRTAYAAIPRALDRVLSGARRTVLRKHGLKLAAIAIALVQLVAGAGLYRTAERVMSHVQTPTTIQVANQTEEASAPSPHPALQQEVEKLAMERDRLRQRVAALEQRMVQVSTELTAVRVQQVATTAAIAPQPATRKAWLLSRASQPELAWVRTRGWFAGPALQSIAPDPPSTR